MLKVLLLQKTAMLAGEFVTTKAPNSLGDFAEFDLLRVPRESPLSQVLLR
jgi:hypothetical protein